MNCPFWVSLHGVAHRFSELLKPLHHDKEAIHEGVCSVGEATPVGVICLQFSLCYPYLSLLWGPQSNRNFYEEGSTGGCFPYRGLALLQGGKGVMAVRAVRDVM